MSKKVKRTSSKNPSVILENLQELEFDEKSSELIFASTSEKNLHNLRDQYPLSPRSKERLQNLRDQADQYPLSPRAKKELIDLHDRANKSNSKSEMQKDLDFVRTQIRKEKSESSGIVKIYKSLDKKQDKYLNPSQVHSISGSLGLGNLYLIRDEFDLAKQSYKDALGMMNIAYRDNSNHPDIAKYHSGMGNIYLHQSQFHLAIKEYHKALSIVKSYYKYTSNNPEIARYCIYVGSAYEAGGKLNAAMKYYQKAKDILIRFYGTNANHPDLAKCYANIGSAYETENELDAAMEYYQEAKNILIGFYGPDVNHPDLAKCYANMGNLYRIEGKLDLAINCFYKYKKIMIKTYESNLNHPDIAKYYIYIGKVYEAKGSFDLAMNYYMKSSKLMIKAYKNNPNNSEIAKCNIHIGNIYEAKSEFNPAMIRYKNALKIMKVTYKGNLSHPDILKCYAYIGSIYMQLSNTELAEKNYNKADNIYEYIRKSATDLIKALPVVTMNTTGDKEAEIKRVNETEPSIKKYMQKLYDAKKLNEFLKSSPDEPHNEASLSDNCKNIKKILTDKRYQVTVHKKEVYLLNWVTVRGGDNTLKFKIANYKDYFQSFLKFNSSEKEYQGTIIYSYIKNILKETGLFKADNFNLLDVGYGDGVITEAIIKSITKVMSKEKILLHGIDLLPDAKKQANKRLKEYGSEDSRKIELITGRFGRDQDQFEKAVKYDLIHASYIYSRDFLEMIKLGKLDEIINDNAIFISIHSLYDSAETFKAREENTDVFSKLSNYAEKLEIILEDKAYVRKSFTYKYSFEFPKINQETWAALKDIDTAQYDVDYRKLGRKANEDDIVNKVNLIQFLLSGPIESIEQGRRGKILDDFRELVEEEQKVIFTAKVSTFLKNPVKQAYLTGINSAIAALKGNNKIDDLGITINIESSDSNSASESNEEISTLGVINEEISN